MSSKGALLNRAAHKMKKRLSSICRASCDGMQTAGTSRTVVITDDCMGRPEQDHLSNKSVPSERACGLDSSPRPVDGPRLRLCDSESPQSPESPIHVLEIADDISKIEITEQALDNTLLTEARTETPPSLAEASVVETAQATSVPVILWPTSPVGSLPRVCTASGVDGSNPGDMGTAYSEKQGVQSATTDSPPANASDSDVVDSPGCSSSDEDDVDEKREEKQECSWAKLALTAGYGMGELEFRSLLPDYSYVDVPEELFDPITGFLLLDPVICSDGHSYERQYLEGWLETHYTSPFTGEQLADKTVIPNIQLRSIRQHVVRLPDEAERVIADRSVASIGHQRVAPAEPPSDWSELRDMATTISSRLPANYDLTPLFCASRKTLKTLWTKLCRLEAWTDFTSSVHIPGWEDVDGHLCPGQRVVYKRFDSDGRVERLYGAVVRVAHSEWDAQIFLSDRTFRTYVVQLDCDASPIKVRFSKLKIVRRGSDGLLPKVALVRAILQVLLAGTDRRAGANSYYMSRQAMLCSPCRKKGVLPVVLKEETGRSTRRVTPPSHARPVSPQRCPHRE